MQMINQFISIIKIVLFKDLLITKKYKFNLVVSFFSVFFYLIIFLQFDKSFSFSSLAITERYDNNLFMFFLAGLIAIELSVVCANSIPMNITFYQTSGMIEELLDDRNTFFYLCIGSTILPIIRTIFKYVIFYIIAFFMISDTKAELSSIFFLIIPIFIYAISLIGIGLIAGALTIYYKRGNPIIQLNTLMVTILGGAFYPVESLTNFFQHISNLVPGKHFIEISRNILTYNDYVAFIINKQIFILMIMGVFLMIIGRFVLKIAIEYSLQKDKLFDY